MPFTEVFVPYEVPESIVAKNKVFKYFIRKYANSIEAKGAEKEELISLTSNIPFDDRKNTQAKMENISMVLVKDYLNKVKSRLAEQVGKIPDRDLLGQMELVSGPNEHVFPRNVALMLFAEQPDQFFPYTRVEIVEFPDWRTDDADLGGLKRILLCLRQSFLDKKGQKPKIG